MTPTTRPFRFSLQAFEATSAKQWVDIVRMAEDTGYSTLFLTDHYFGPGDIATSSGHRPVDLAPLTAMATAAAITTELRVGCRVFAVDFHHPSSLASTSHHDPQTLVLGPRSSHRSSPA
jgi:alkanesulfonate monooxygenase SsuD/methylene tetrahydromethanopterin reductase-like flavin-dependent oxidoreductase (luciferase family)